MEASRWCYYHFFQLPLPKDSKKKKKKFGHWSLRIGGKKMFIQRFSFKNVKNFFCCGDFTPLLSKSFQIWDHFFPLLLRKDFENLKSLETGLWEVKRSEKHRYQKKSCSVRQNSPKNKHFFLQRFYTLFFVKFIKSETTSFH